MNDDFLPRSPFAYLAGTPLEKRAAGHGVTIASKPLGIMVLYARASGAPLKDWDIGRLACRASFHVVDTGQSFCERAGFDHLDLHLAGKPWLPPECACIR